MLGSDKKCIFENQQVTVRVCYLCLVTFAVMFVGFYDSKTPKLTLKSVFESKDVLENCVYKRKIAMEFLTQDDIMQTIILKNILIYPPNFFCLANFPMKTLTNTFRRHRIYCTTWSTQPPPPNLISPFAAGINDHCDIRHLQ